MTALPRNLVALVLALLLALGSALPALAQEAAPEPVPAPPRIPSQEPRSLEELRPPQVASRAAILVDDQTGEVLYARDPHQRRAVASLTKMVTAMVAVELGEISQTIPATEHSPSIPMAIGVQPGDELTLADLLHGLMLWSGNDAALVIAEGLGGGRGQDSIDRFVARMNELVGRLGLQDTNFVNPNGLDGEGHHSTAYDMAQVARAYMRVPVLAQVAATPHYEIAGEPDWSFRNINGFLFSYPGAVGIKTGFESLAGYCLAASAVRSDRRLISVVLNSNVYLTDTSLLMDYGFHNYAWLLLNARSNPLLDRPGADGDGSRVLPADAPELLFAPSQLWYAHSLDRTERFERRLEVAG